jgi:DNA mismatch repair protein MSH6
VPNDVNLGGEQHAPFMLLTGPNMGGKSTLLRQVCLAVILAQVFFSSIFSLGYLVSFYWP